MVGFVGMGVGVTLINLNPPLPSDTMVRPVLKVGLGVLVGSGVGVGTGVGVTYASSLPEEYLVALGNLSSIERSLIWLERTSISVSSFIFASTEMSVTSLPSTSIFCSFVNPASADRSTMSLFSKSSLSN